MTKDSRTDFPHAAFTAYRCSAPVAGVHKAPDAGSAIDDQLLYGQRFHVASIVDDGWAYGQVQPLTGKQGGYVGFVDAGLLTEDGDAPAHKISALKAPVFSGADIKSPIQAFLSFGSRLSGAPAGDFIHTEQGFVHSRHVDDISAAQGDFVTLAAQYLGLPYVWGGKSADGVDCSGLVQTALWACGRDCPRDADQQEAALGSPVDITPDLSGLRRGDLVFWTGHVGIMEDAQTLLHANGHFMTTRREPLNDAARRIQKSAGPITSIKRL